jgi:putative transcriptional regulator
MKKKRNIFGELMGGVQNMKEHREGEITLKTFKPETKDLPNIDAKFIRKTREELHTSQGLFARLLHVNPRTLANWEQGRSKPNEQAATLILLVGEFPDRLEKLRSLVV